MSDRDFEINGKHFKLCKIDAFKQFHIVRRFGPVLSELLPVLKDAQKHLKNIQSISEDEKLDQVAKIAGPFITGISKLSDQDADFVLLGLLASVEVQQAQGNWAKLAQGSMMMIQDMELPLMLQVAGRAFMYNLSGFFSVLPQK